ncbi:MAG: hypothetical protein ACFFDI_01790 [Promethearchaeota archaeon]
MGEEERKSLNVESVKTPKGITVPTVKGMENVVNHIYSDLIPIVEANTKIVNNLERIEKSIQKLENRMEGWEKFLISTITILGQMSNQLQAIKIYFEEERSIEPEKEDLQKQDLLVIRDTLAELLVRLKAQLYGEEL